MLALIRGGVYPWVAARSIGINVRTFREWMARGHGEHPTRPPTRQLKALAEAVGQASSEARAGAEIRVYRADPKAWLKAAAASRAGEEGWTPPVSEADWDRSNTPAQEPHQPPTDEQAAEVLNILIEAGAIAPFHEPHCECRCQGGGNVQPAQPQQT